MEELLGRSSWGWVVKVMRLGRSCEQKLLGRSCWGEDVGETLLGRICCGRFQEKLFGRSF